MTNIKDQVEKVLGEYMVNRIFTHGRITADAYELRDKLVDVIKQTLQSEDKGSINNAIYDLSQAISNIEDAQRTLEEIVED